MNKNNSVLIIFVRAPRLKQVKTRLQANLGARPTLDLGQRMDNAFGRAFERGYRKALIIGSDLPGIDSLVISIALTKLDAHDLVLGPSSDGGYYLVGLKQRQNKLFRDIEWSTPTVLQDTIRLANKQKLAIYQMEQRTDVDTFENLVELWRELQQEMERRDEVCCPQTFAALQKIFSKLPELLIS